MAAARQKEINVSMAVVATITRGRAFERESAIPDAGGFVPIDPINEMGECRGELCSHERKALSSQVAVYLSKPENELRRAAAEAFGALLAGADHAQVIVAEDSRGMPVREVELDSVAPDNLSVARLWLRFEHGKQTRTHR